jgi:hypothetical protein
MHQICIVEPSLNHEEVILPQIELLRDSFAVSVLASPKLLATDLLSSTADLYRPIPLLTGSEGGRLGRFVSLPLKYSEIKKVVTRNVPDVVIFNTVSTVFDLALIAILFRNQKKVQIAHNFQRFVRSPWKQFYKAFDLNLVLSEEVHNYITTAHPECGSVDYFLPIFFDNFRTRQPSQDNRVTQNSNRLKIGVFGSIDDQRRNYSGLLTSLADIRRSGKAIRFDLYLVGKIPTKYLKFIREQGLTDIVRYYEEYVSYADMFTLLESMDLVMFLVDSQVHNHKHYNRYKITGTSTLVKSFRKACVSSTDFAVDGMLADKCFYYSHSNIQEFNDQIAAGDIFRETVKAKVARYADNRLFDFDVQRQRFTASISNLCRV